MMTKSKTDIYIDKGVKPLISKNILAYANLFFLSSQRSDILYSIFLELGENTAIQTTMVLNFQ